MTRISPWSFVGILTVLVATGIAVAAVRLGGEPAYDDAEAKDAGKDKIPAETKLDPSKARVEGVAVDEAGKPVAGAVVSTVRSHVGSEGSSVRTAVDGAFRLLLDEASARYETIVATADDGRRQGMFEFHDTVLGRVARAMTDY
jgi:hypothetical protein